eukprot:scaffold13204_cov66-Cyclotella_meneghiniana.AAC.7
MPVVKKSAACMTVNCQSYWSTCRMTVHACQSQSSDFSRLATGIRLPPVLTYFCWPRPLTSSGSHQGSRRLTGTCLPVVPYPRRLPGRAYIMRRRKMRRLCDWRLATGSRLAFPGHDVGCGMGEARR